MRYKRRSTQGDRVGWNWGAKHIEGEVEEVKKLVAHDYSFRRAGHTSHFSS